MRIKIHNFSENKNRLQCNAFVKIFNEKLQLLMENYYFFLNPLSMNKQEIIKKKYIPVTVYAFNYP